MKNEPTILANPLAVALEENRRLRIQLRQIDEALRLERLKHEALAARVEDVRKLLKSL